MALIDLIDITKKFGSKTVLDGINLSIKEGERVAIIGQNGGGKSTLMKIICGLYIPDDGRVIRQNNLKVEMLMQTPEFNSTITVKEAIRKELDDIFSILKEYHEVLSLTQKDHENKELLKRQDELVKQIESLDAWNIENKIERVMENFRLKEYEDRLVCSLSGGEIRRVALGGLILKNPDILLLDEPTNHLDVYMVKFLEEMLLLSGKSIVFISHDRYFIEKIATRTVEVENGAINSFDGGYENYLIKKQELLASLTKSHETLLKQLRAEEEWLRKGVKARLKRNEGRKQRVYDMREQAKRNPGVLKKVKLELKRATMSFNNTTITQNRRKMLFECINISKTLGDKLLFKNFSTRILQGERIGIVGANGMGKTTLLKLFLGELEPDSGVIKRGNVKIGYFDQRRENIDETKSLIENFCPNGGDHIMVRGSYMHVYGYLKNFLFPKEFLDKPVTTLSGGEKNRLALAKLFTQDFDCLILDEPTNDLDISTINILEEYFMDFDGAILIVSHDRYFVDKIANKLFIFENEKITESHISYTEYLEYEDEVKELEEIFQEVKESKTIQKERVSSQKLSYRQNKILEEYPSMIEEIENRIKELDYALSTPEIYQKVGIQELFEELEEKKGDLNRMENEYFEVLTIHESLK
ncbi:ABC-F family ATP-binding cassette domain-containing protein [uncultured Campylobacter sp.]|uniref:ABC-F family ATP-binding cassette domain-containing protein n=1 Tax=uncultured Campylobacter sp. TaxID=218934 RepID=UPI002620D2F9|nr:ABC-F family ATP-binding cassette domain-containing protein [uncultured Campylobacter sp.]